MTVSPRPVGPSGSGILGHPGPDDFVRFPADFGQRFLVTIDAEEEFDWSKPFERTGHGLAHVPRLAKFQQFCEGYGVAPLWLVDHPVACDPRTADALGEAVRAGRADVGVQLHPWVNPPHEEELNVHNSFAGNLSPELERAKLRALRNLVEQAFGVPPLVYRAGRYGVGPATASILHDCSIAIDSSVRARFDYSSHGGPDFRHHPLRPWWVDPARQLMELPLTTIYWGPLRRHGTALYPALWRVPRLRGLLARMGLLERIPLTPEGVSAEEALRGIDIALDDGLPLLVFSFHSPSLRPGNTPYVRDEDELDRLYDWWRTVFSYLERRGIRPTTVREIMTAAQV